MRAIKRIFIGIHISQEIGAAIHNWRSFLNDLNVRWIKEKDMHLTLYPPWNADSNEIDRITAKFEKAFQEFQPFIIEFEKVLFGPNPRKPRLIWLEGPPHEILSQVKHCIENLLGHGDNRPLKPHVTIARFKPKDFRDFPIKNLNEKVTWQQKVTEITLFESIEPLGSGYNVIKEIKLG